MVNAADQFVTFAKSGFAIAEGGRAMPIVVDVADYEGVRMAAEDLQADIEKVCGAKPELSTAISKECIIVGSWQSPVIQRLVKAKKIRGQELKGKWEKYLLQVVEQPVEGVESALVIAGSDKRGTIYGIYELSRQMGVSPWYWWMDVPVAHHDAIYVRQGIYTDGEPHVRYRGIFINDEHPCFFQWSNEKFGGQNARCYRHVFELLLRLKANYMWPAMWGNAFYDDDPENGVLADKMGIVMGTSHHEPMALAQQDWKRRKGHGAWNYATNGAELRDFWRGGIERSKNWETMVTIGMRGDGDEAMSDEADTRLLERIVADQRQIIREVTGRPADKTPQVWALYKEVLDYYDKGMRVPDDVIMLLCDDNWGNVRRVPTAKERQHKGGWGLYYHVDYVGAPRNSKWLNVTPTANMWEQLTLAADYGLDRMWILNVGDLKPMEYPISLFMDMAWNPRHYRADNVTDYTKLFCQEVLGSGQAAEASRILDLCCRYAGRVTAEMLDADTYNIYTGEWKSVADDYMRLEAEALRQYITLAPEYRDAYQQLILFPVQAMGNVYQMYYAQAMNRLLASQGDPEANHWAERVRQAFRRDSLLCAAYNHDIAGGKWNKMMIQKHIGYKIWNDNFPCDTVPETVAVPDRRGGYVFEMQDGCVSIEAEHYHEATAGAEVTWTAIPGLGRTLSGMTLMPYTQPTGDAAISYRWNSAAIQDSVLVHVIVKSTLDYLNKGGLTYTVSLDGSVPVTVNFNSRLNEDRENVYSIFYPTVARRVVESVVTLPVNRALKEHTLTLHPCDPAIVFEKIVIDGGGYQPQYLFGRESPKR